jgi:hypothetical protein
MERGGSENNTTLPLRWRMWFLPRQVSRCCYSSAIAYCHEILRSGSQAISNNNKRMERGGIKNNIRLNLWGRFEFLPRQVLHYPHYFAPAHCHEKLRRGYRAISNGIKRTERGGSKNNIRLSLWRRLEFLPRQVLRYPQYLAPPH